MSQSQFPSGPESTENGTEDMTAEEKAKFEKIVGKGAEGLHSILGLTKSIKDLKHRAMDGTDIPDVETPPELTDDAA